MMILPFVGFVFYLKNECNRWAVILYCFLAFYLTTAWDVWDYGGTAGRAMVQHYVIFAFPLAYLVEWVQLQNWRKLVFYPIVILFTYLNVWWIYHSHIGDITVTDSSELYYKATIGRWHVSPETKKLFDNPHVFLGEPEEFDLLYQNDLSSDSTEYVSLNKDNDFGGAYQVTRKQKYYNWIRAEALFTCINKETDYWKQANFTIKFYKDDIEIQQNTIKPHRFLDNGWIEKISVEAKPPTDWDSLAIEFWNWGSEQELIIKNLSVIGFDK